MEDILKELNDFLAKAALSTYAGGGQNLDPENSEFGMKELEYGSPKDRWYYKDSYNGFFQSWGREVVWHNQKPFWAQVYGGGMEKKYGNDAKFVHQTFDFLKKALSAGDKTLSFQPRGPKEFNDGDWTYLCKMKGNIKKFRGSEKILFKGKVVFTHDFVGGLFVYRD